MEQQLEAAHEQLAEVGGQTVWLWLNALVA